MRVFLFLLALGSFIGGLVFLEVALGPGWTVTTAPAAPVEVARVTPDPRLAALAERQAALARQAEAIRRAESTYQEALGVYHRRLETQEATEAVFTARRLLITSDFRAEFKAEREALEAARGSLDEIHGAIGAQRQEYNQALEALVRDMESVVAQRGQPAG